MRSLRVAWAVVSSLVVVSPLLATVKDFDFKDPKGVNTMTFVLDSELEPFAGYAAGITGTVSFDPEKPEAISGSLRVESKSLTMTNPKMTEVLHGADWLDVQKHAAITFEFKKVEKFKSENGQLEFVAVGPFTCKGITRELRIPVRASYLAGKLGQRLRGAKGDLLVLRASFSIDRKDFDIKRDFGPEVVAEEIQIRANIVGSRAE